MSHKLLTLNVRGLNSSRKRRQVFRWLHLQRSDIIFLQETYSSTETIKRWEAKWGGKVVASHSTTHSKGVMVLFEPNLNVTINKTLADKNGRYILAETSIDETNIVFVNIYAPNDPSQQILFLRDLSSSGYQKDDLRKLYLLLFEVTKEVKLSMFQYKIIHNILCTKSLLFKMKKEDSPRCPFCPADHTIIHLFTECAQATLFWKEFLDWALRMENSKLSLSIKLEIMFGIINNESK